MTFLCCELVRHRCIRKTVMLSLWAASPASAEWASDKRIFAVLGALDLKPDLPLTDCNILSCFASWLWRGRGYTGGSDHAILPLGCFHRVRWGLQVAPGTRQAADWARMWPLHGGALGSSAVGGCGFFFFEASKARVGEVGAEMSLQRKSWNYFPNNAHQKR